MLISGGRRNGGFIPPAGKWRPSGGGLYSLRRDGMLFDVTFDARASVRATCSRPTTQPLLLRGLGGSGISMKS